MDPGAEPALARALAEAATWVGCDRVAIARIEPPTSRDRLESSLRTLGLG